MSDLGRFKLKLRLPKPPKFARKLAKIVPFPVPPGMPRKMPSWPALPGFAHKKSVSYSQAPAVSPEVYAPSAAAVSQPTPNVTYQPYYDATVYPSGTSPDYQTPSTPMSFPPSASVMSYDSGYPQEIYASDVYTSPSSPFDTSMSFPESPSDSPDYWGTESEMQGLGATTDTSWYQDLIPQITQAYVDITKAKHAAKTPATVPTYTRPPVTTQPGFMGMNLNTILMVGAGGLGLFLLYNVMKKRRR